MMTGLVVVGGGVVAAGVLGVFAFIVLILVALAFLVVSAVPVVPVFFDKAINT